MTKTITLTIPHSLGQEEARNRIQKGIADARAQFGQSVAQVEETWTGDHMDFRVRIMGQNITGRVDIAADSATLNVDVPWLLSALVEKIRPQLEREGTKLLQR